MSYPPVVELVPHRPPFVLLDSIEEMVDGCLRACAVIRADSFSLHEGRATPIYGIELIAQAVAAFSGIIERERGGSARIGFIVSCRTVEFLVDELPIGDPLEISVERRWGHDEFGLFLGQVCWGESILVRAELGVFAGDTSGVLIWPDAEL